MASDFGAANVSAWRINPWNHFAPSSPASSQSVKRSAMVSGLTRKDGCQMCRSVGADWAEKSSFHESWMPRNLVSTSPPRDTGVMVRVVEGGMTLGGYADSPTDNGWAGN